ncbi:MAG: PDZ domain-containing protein, partial [Limnobacter sp.]|nr:PDZ domain-containing protein [Limnobacter sp.]
ATNNSAQVGDVVLAIGNPFGVGQTVTMGIISALGRNHVGINTFENFIQTDAAINPGNSGGALVDTEGRLLGINTAIFSRSGGSLGIGFAIPGDTVRDVLDQIVKTGSVTRGYIGVEQQNINKELVKAFDLPIDSGVIVAGLVQGGPADEAGIEVGDILLRLDGKEIKDTADMLNAVAGTPPGTSKTFTVLRSGQEKEIQVTVGTRPKPKAEFSN